MSSGIDQSRRLVGPELSRPLPTKPTVRTRDGVVKGTVRPVSVPAKQNQKPRDVAQIESDIAAKRIRLASNLEALSYDTQPKVLGEKGKAKAREGVHAAQDKAKAAVLGTPDEAPSIPPAVTGALAGLVVGLVVLRIMKMRD